MLGFVLRPGDTSDQTLRVGMCGSSQNVEGTAQFYNPAGVHYGGPV